MQFLLLFFLELFLLFLLSRMLTREISYMIHRITRSKTITIHFLAFLFLPGTLIHELSHYFMATILFVHTGEIRLMPEIAGSEIKLGTVAIAKTDPIRRFFIGVAPFLFGTGIILSIIYLILKFGLINNPLVLIVAGYCVFEISNTMYSSKKDLEGALELLILLTIISATLYFAGVRISFENFADSLRLASLFQKTCYFLLIPLIIDIPIVIFLKLLNK